MNIDPPPDRSDRLVEAVAAHGGHDPIDVDPTDAAVLARRVDESANAIADYTRGEVPVPDDQRAAALALAIDLLATAGRHGITRADLDGVTSLAGDAVHAIVARDRDRQRSGFARAPRPVHGRPPQTGADRDHGLDL